MKTKELGLYTLDELKINIRHDYNRTMKQNVRQIIAYSQPSSAGELSNSLREDDVYVTDTLL